MAEVLVSFTTVVTADDGRRFEPRACGGIASDGLHEGWVEFRPLDANGTPVRTPRETLQPNRADLVYWAMGLTQTYLDGALRRALPDSPVVLDRERSLAPIFDEPAPHRAADSAAPSYRPHALLNPYEVYQQGESVLLAELGAFDVGHLRDIALSFGFASPELVSRSSAPELTRIIVERVRTSATRASADQRAEANPG